MMGGELLTVLNVAVATNNKKIRQRQKDIDDVFKPDSQGNSEWVSVDDLPSSLDWGGNGVFRHGVVWGDNRYIWEKYPTKHKIKYIRTSGFSDDYLYGHKRPINKDIRKKFEGCPCVACGSFNQIVIDHKNDLYNNIRVLNVDTQLVEDFQPLCNSCNLKKRQVCKMTWEQGERYGATNIPQFAPWGIDFVKGNASIDFKDPDAMVGTYWYDPVEFNRQVYNIISTRPRA